MRTFYLFFLAFLPVIDLAGCTASAQKDGICARTCGSRPVGGGKIRGIPLSEAVSFSKCSEGKELPQQTYVFFIYDDLSTGAAPTASTGDLPSRIPKAGVAFTPIVPGFNTLDTPSSEWCTDSCGYAEVKFTPTCAQQAISIGVLVPGMLYDGATTVPSTKFTVTLD
jgi:hypothetical protein